MSTGTVAPVPRQQFFDNNGAVLAAGLLYTYTAGTSTPLATYQDINLTTANANPIVLDSAGRTPAGVYLSEATYKFVLKDSAGNTIWTQDNVPSTQVGQSGGLGEIFAFGGDVSSPVTATAYPSGATVDKLHVGTAIYNVDSANLVGTYKIEAMIRGDGTVIVTAAIVNLSDGAPDTPLATAASAAATSTTGERVVSGAITFASSGTAKNYGIKVKLNVAGAGYVWGVRLIRTA